MNALCGADCACCQWGSACPGCSDEKSFIARYIKANGKEAYEELKQTLTQEINELNIPDMPKIDNLYALVGNFVNLEYPLPSGQTAKFLDNNSMYLGNQVQCRSKEVRCYGMVACPEFLLVSEYGENGEAPEIVVYKRR